MLIKVVDGVPELYSLARLRADNRNVLFPPGQVPPETLAEFGCFEATTAPRPSTSYDEAAERDALPTEQPDGSWVFGWTVRSLTAGELSELRARLGASPMQLCKALVNDGRIGDAVARAWASGDLPTPLDNAISGAGQTAKAQRDAVIDFLTADRRIPRDHWAIEQLRQNLGWSEEQMDNLFLAARNE